MKQGLGAAWKMPLLACERRDFIASTHRRAKRLFDSIRQDRIREWATSSCCFCRHACNTVFCSSQRQIAHRLSDGDKSQGKGARQSTNLLADAHFQTLAIGVAVAELPK